MLEALSKIKKLEKCKQLYEDAVTYDNTWQRDAQDDFKFRDGFQWPDAERSILEEELRPCLTFNLSKASIDLIMGMNEDNRKKFRASPVEPSDAFLAEVLNDTSDYISDSEDFTDEEDAALESCAICGRGYVAIDFVPDPNKFGEIRLTEVAVPVHEVHFDPAARRATLEDASYVCWDRWLSRQDFKVRYPKISDKKLDKLISGNDALSSTEPGDMPQQTYDADAVSVISDDADYDTPANDDLLIYYDKKKDMVRVIHLEYWETYTRYFGYDPQSNGFVEFTGIPLQQARDAYAERYDNQELIYETIKDKKVKWIQFTGTDILYDNDSPLPYPGFSIVPCFAYRDVSGKTANHFGIIRLIKDPQREINKRWSQALNMLNQQVQPGLYAEQDAFVHQKQAEMAMKEAGSIVWTQNGALTAGKIKERTVPTFPNAPMQMEQFSQDIMKKITGINPDLLGQDRGRQEAGVVIRLRQQQGVTLLKSLFKSYNKMKKELFKRQLAIIMEYMPDNQILRILGQGSRYKIDKNSGMIVDTQTGLQAQLRDVRNLQYNIRAEESPGNMTKRALEIATFMEMQQAGFPVDPEIVIDKLEISATEKMRWIQFIQQSREAASKQQDMQLQLMQEFKDREVRTDEQRNLIDFIIGMAKLQQASEKEQGKNALSVATLAQKEQNDLRTFVSSLASVLASTEKSGETKSESKK